MRRWRTRRAPATRPGRSSANSAAGMSWVLVCCGRPWSGWPRREQARLLRGPGHSARGRRAADQERLPQAGAPVPPRSESGGRAGRGALQGGGRGVRRAGGRRQAARATTSSAMPVSAAAAGRKVSTRRFSPTSTTFSATSSASGAAGANAAGAGARRGADLRYDLQIDFADAAAGMETVIQIPRLESCGPMPAARVRRAAAPRPAPSAAAGARSATSRDS